MDQLGETVRKGFGSVVDNLGKAVRDAFAQAEGLDVKVNGTNVSALDDVTLNGTVNGTDPLLSGKKTPATFEGLVVAYVAMLVMALVPIYFGSWRSVRFQKHSKVFVNSLPDYTRKCFLGADEFYFSPEGK